MRIALLQFVRKLLDVFEGWTWLVKVRDEDVYGGVIEREGESFAIARC